MAQTQNQTRTGTIAAYFEDNSDALQAVEALKTAGFSSAHLGVAHRGNSSSGYGSDSSYGSGMSDTSSRTSSAGGAVRDAAAKTGEKAESAWDKVKDFFSGNDAEPYASERSQGDLATREITGSGLGSNSSSSRYDEYDNADLHQSLSGLSVPDEHSRYFEHRLGNSSKGAVVTVNADDRAAEAQTILTRYGGDLGEQAEGYEYTQPTGSSDTRNTRDGQNIQLLGEVLRVHKERIDRGEVRLRKEIITENQTIQVPVTREEIVIERHAAGQNTQASGSIGDNSEIRIPLSEERASVEKSTVVREEVSVGKKSVEEVRDLGGEIRREELVVDDSTKRGN